ncbi:MAG: hypothetical protein N2112_15375 [Gemmataceae bacterium]|jgi:uncharacterized protein YcfL|nr:hypothetical protein [Gemmataceae bacterium]
MKRILVLLFVSPLILTGCTATEYIPVAEPVPVFVEPAPVLVAQPAPVVTDSSNVLPPPTPVP